MFPWNIPLSWGFSVFNAVHIPAYSSNFSLTGGSVTVVTGMFCILYLGGLGKLLLYFYSCFKLTFLSFYSFPKLNSLLSRYLFSDTFSSYIFFSSLLFGLFYSLVYLRFFNVQIFLMLSFPSFSSALSSW